MKGRGLHILLICSLVLNIFVIGGLAGAAIVWKRAEAERPLVGAGRAGRLRQAAMNLSPQYRRELRRTIAGTLRTLKPQIEEARAARLEAGRLLVEPEFDQPAFKSALDRARTADLAIRARLEATIAEFAVSLPAEEREALGQGLMRPGPAARRQGGARP